MKPATKFLSALFIGISILTSIPQKARGQDSNKAFDITLKMLDRCAQINTLYFEMTKTERVDGDYLTESFRTKLRNDPYQIYSKKIEDGKSPELLFRIGENDNRALINPDGFPWFNIQIDPLGLLMRRKQHHTVYETGYNYALSIIHHLIEKYGKDEVAAMASFLREENIDGIPCYVLQFDNHHFKYINYTVKGDENVLDIARKQLVSEYMIVEINEDVDGYKDIEDGQVIRIPNDYCLKLIIAIDKERYVPISIKVFDEKSLYEQFEYRNVKVNPNFKEEEFSADNPEYGF